MKRIAIFLLAACGGNKTEVPATEQNLALVEGCADAPNQQIVEGDIVADVTWSKDKVYRLGGVINVVGATLTIEAGTVVQGTVAQSSALIVTTSGRLVTQGTAAEPVVFTSCKPVGQRAAGNWGGVALLGKARVNTTDGTNQLEGLGNEERYRYGGTDDTHDCGSLRYTRVEFAGFEFQPDKELNALTFAGCGSETSVDYIQAHQGEDDLLEFFGGNVNVKHVVLTQGNDDGFDWQLGYTGKAQFVLYQHAQHPEFTQSERCFEADNNEQNFTAQPYSNPIIANASCIGMGKDQLKRSVTPAGAKLRRGTKGRIVNSLFTEINGLPFEVTASGADTVQANVSSGELIIDHSLFFNNKPFDSGANAFELSMMGNSAMVNADGVNPLLADPLNVAAPNARPAAGSPALDASAAFNVETIDPFFEAAPFRGAIGTVDWTAGWTSYPAN